jgi:hypothetical protein
MGFNIGRWLGHVVSGAAKSVGGDVLQAARQNLPPEMQQGFDQAVSVLNTPGGPAGILQARIHIDPHQIPGFDYAANIASGLSQMPGGIPPGLSPAAVAGYLATHGMQGAHPDANAAVMATIAAAPDPAVKQGAAQAIIQIRAKEGWWPKFLRAIGLKH